MSFENIKGIVNSSIFMKKIVKFVWHTEYVYNIVLRRGCIFAWVRSETVFNTFYANYVNTNKPLAVLEMSKQK